MKIIRNTIIGFLLIKCGNFVWLEPIQLSWDWNGFDYDIEIDEGSKIIGMLPCPSGTYAVFGENDRGIYNLGLEFPGADHPNWEGEIALAEKRHLMTK